LIWNLHRPCQVYHQCHPPCLWSGIGKSPINLCTAHAAYSWLSDADPNVYPGTWSWPIGHSWAMPSLYSGTMSKYNISGEILHFMPYQVVHKLLFRQGWSMGITRPVQANIEYR
jgi:hypothetical protein